jgi:hypothetical protein
MQFPREEIEVLALENAENLRSFRKRRDQARSSRVKAQEQVT